VLIAYRKRRIFEKMKMMSSKIHRFAVKVEKVKEELIYVDEGREGGTKEEAKMGTLHRV
jgi:hypothetical protein